jgi:ribosomal protein RSM22 (predicted rRNA methylase)
VAEISPSALARAASDLSWEYRERETRRPQLDVNHRAAYLVTRMPATYAVLSRVLREARVRVPELRIESLLDLGAGPGTAMWAAAADLPEISRIVLVEDSADWIAIGKELAAHAESAVFSSTEWRQGSITDSLPDELFDVVTISYALNELRAGERIGVAEAAWKRTGKLLVMTEPGTPAGFAHLRELRTHLLTAGAHIVAPCPHGEACPIVGTDWCHFSQRLSRSAQHRLAKDGELGYEDEKYAYLIFAREPVALPEARILRHPQRHSGHVKLELCTREGLKTETISRKHGQRYREAKKAEWGDVVP